MKSIADAPDIRRTEATGWPVEARWPVCPVCGAEGCGVFYRDGAGEILGCEDCVAELDAWELSEDDPEERED